MQSLLILEIKSTSKSLLYENSIQQSFPKHSLNQVKQSQTPYLVASKKLKNLQIWCIIVPTLWCKIKEYARVRLFYPNQSEKS